MWEERMGGGRCDTPGTGARRGNFVRYGRDGNKMCLRYTGSLSLSKTHLSTKKISLSLKRKPLRCLEFEDDFLKPLKAKNLKEIVFKILEFKDILSA